MLRKAFTLVELLVVIAIIGMLVGLLLPAVQQAREAARQMSCGNNLRQLGIASMNHESTAQSYPSGGWTWYWVGDPDRGFGEEQPGSWAFSILPFAEQNALFQHAAIGDPDSASGDKKSKMKDVLGTPVSLFYCPSRRKAKLYPGSFSGYNTNASSIGTCKTDYACNWGTGPSNGTAAIGTTPPRSYSEANSMTEKNSWQTYAGSNGISFFRSNVSVGEVTDGTTNTYLVGEKYLNASGYELGTDGGEDQTPYNGTCNDNARVGHYDPSNASNKRVPMQDRPNVAHAGTFGSAHAGTFGMAMADASVHRISYSIDPQVHMNLACRNDGNVVTLP